MMIFELKKTKISQKCCQSDQKPYLACGDFPDCSDVFGGLLGSNELFLIFRNFEKISTLSKLQVAYTRQWMIGSEKYYTA